VTALLITNLGDTPLLGRGKVRDLYAVGDALLMVATDRISAFDHVLGTGIPGKGKILTQISLFWFDLLKEVVPNHIITANVSEYPAELHRYADQLEGRSMLVRAVTWPARDGKNTSPRERCVAFRCPAVFLMVPSCLSRCLPPPPRARTERTTKTFPLRRPKN
jgi:phosphoribosylaminoimidazole-succinocarboxamide synthase